MTDSSTKRVKWENEKKSAEYHRANRKRHNGKRKGKPRLDRIPGGQGIKKKTYACSPLQLEWVAEFVKSGSIADAAKKVGIKFYRARDWSRHPVVRAEIDKVRATIREKTGYGLEAAMREAEEGMQFAREMGNAMAFAKLLEIKAKMHALLIDKKDIQMSTPFHIVVKGVRDTLPSPHTSNFEKTRDVTTLALPQPQPEIVTEPVPVKRQTVVETRFGRSVIDNIFSNDELELLD